MEYIQIFMKSKFTSLLCNMNLKFLTAIPFLILAHCAGSRTNAEPVPYQSFPYPCPRWNQPITVISEKVFTYVPRRSSPTLTIRAIRSHLCKWTTQNVNIVTERKFFIIAKQWVHEIQKDFEDVTLTILDNGKSDPVKQTLDYAYEEDVYFGKLRNTTIFLLDSATLSSHLFQDAQINAVKSNYTFGKVVIVGNCIPKAMKKFSADVHINTVLFTGSVKDWLQGHVPLKNNTFYSLQAKSETSFVAIPIRTANLDGSIPYAVKPHECYGYMEDKHIFWGISKLQHDIATCKNNLVYGFGGDYVNSLQSYLKFSIHCKWYNELIKISDFSEDYDQSPDIHLRAASPLNDVLMFFLYPPFFTDSIAFIVRYEDEKIALMDLVVMFDCPTWTLLFFGIISVNLCCLAIYYQSPALQISIKVRNKVMSKMANCFSLNGLTFFQSEWQQGPTASAKWTIFAFNILFFFLSSIYIPLFTKKIFSLGKLTPFTVQDIHNNTFAFADTVEFLMLFAYKYCPLEKGQRSKLCNEDPWSMILQDDTQNVFSDLTDGKWKAVVGAASIALKPMRKFPEIGIVKDFTEQLIFSFKSDLDFDFVEIFHSITLKMKEIGAMNKLITTHFDFKVVPPSVLNPVSFSLMWYLLVILGIGIVTALIACLIEILTI